ncbi:MAG TPA: hypothetical protein VHX87_04630 [Galbitalea sp.]|nr:hypothetical protein [Galbitalea sp.]
MVNARGVGDRVRAFFVRGASSEVGAAILRRVAPSALYSAALLPVMGLAAYIMGSTPGEYTLFGPAGFNLLTGHWNLVFVNPKVQAGPLELFPYGIARVIGLHSQPQWFAFYLVMLYVMTFLLSLVIYLPIYRVSGRLGRYVPFLALGIALLGAFLPTDIVRGHPAESMVPLLWIVAGCLSRERMFASAGVILALSAGFEVWGVLGVPVLFLSPSPRILRAAIAAIITGAVIYLPFVLTGTFRMFEYHWFVSLGTLYRLVWPGLTSFPWTLRIAQAVLALAAGWGTALATRKGVYGVWLVPMAIISVRFVFDPLLDFYYWMAPATVAICALGATLYLRKWIPALIAAGLIASLWIPPTRSVVAAIAMTVLVGLCVAALKIVERHGREQMTTPPPPGRAATDQLTT